MKNTLNDEKLKDKISEEDKKTLMDKIEDTLKWMDSNQDAQKEEYDAKQKDVESVANPIMQKIYQQGGQPGGAEEGMPGGMPTGGMGGMGNGRNATGRTRWIRTNR